MQPVRANWMGGDRHACSMARGPTREEEDAKKPLREWEPLVQEKPRIENRTEALLPTQGIGGGRPCARGNAMWPTCALGTDAHCQPLCKPSSTASDAASS